MDLDGDDLFDPRIRNVIVLDDLMSIAAKDPRINNLFTEGSHHRNLTVIALNQNMYFGKDLTQRRNCHYLVRTGPRLFTEIRRSHEGALLVPGRGSEARNPAMEETMYQRLRGRSIGRHAHRSNDLSVRH